MKRGGPLKKHKQHGWNSTLRPKSLKRQREDRKLEPTLKQYRKDFPMCQAIGCIRKGTDIHEMAGAAVRMESRSKRSCILHLCRNCHGLVQYYPKAEQLAMKMIADPQGYDLDEYNAVVKGYLTQRTQKEVDKAASYLLGY